MYLFFPSQFLVPGASCGMFYRKMSWYQAQTYELSFIRACIEAYSCRFGGMLAENTKNSGMPSCVKRSLKSVFLFGVYFRIILFIFYIFPFLTSCIFFDDFFPCKIRREKLVVEESCINDDFLFKRLKLSFAAHLVFFHSLLA